MIIVIRAGGLGTRLWPVSRKNRPKQFLKLLGSQTLLRMKYGSIAPLLKRRRDCYVTVAEPFAALVRRILPEVPPENIIPEPVGRNTGPGIALESAVLRARRPIAEDPVVASLTVDDVFARPERFRKALRASERLLLARPGVVVALADHAPMQDNGLSYLTFNRAFTRVGGQPFHRITRWVEKPEPRVLGQLLRQPHVAAHTGLYVWRLSTVNDGFRSAQPSWIPWLDHITRSAKNPRTLLATLRKTFHNFPNVSVEQSLVRSLPEVIVTLTNAGWSDTGKWSLIHHLLPRDQHENATTGRVLLLDSHGSLVMSGGKRLVAGIGLHNMVVVETEDAVLVVPRDRANEVSAIVKALAGKETQQWL
jgi:mannose-1-phosphate guanylyltransferase